MYDHYIALDWAKKNMALARMTGKSDKVKVMEETSNLYLCERIFKKFKREKDFYC